MTSHAIIHTTAITMDAERRIIDDATVLFENDRITAVGPAGDVPLPETAEVIDGRDMITLPGLIDSHAHAGHGLTRNLGSGDGDAWFQACETIYTRGSTPAFWQAEARLSGLERLKAGITTCTMLLGGGADHYRTDTAEAGNLHCDATREIGIRTMLAAGLNRRPFPKPYRSLDLDREVSLSFEDQLEVCGELAQTNGDFLNDGAGVCLIMPVYSPEDFAQAPEDIRAMCRAAMDLREKHGLLFTQDGHRSGSIALAEDLGILGPWAYLSHSVDLTPEDMDAAKRSGASIVHNPSAIMSVLGRCPAPELREMGVNVALGSDAAAPDRGYDMFRHMAQCLHYHRRHFRDPEVMMPRDVLEMCTIDAAKAIGMDADLGSLEPGKKADIVMLDRRKPHLYPPMMPLTTVAQFANAADVHTVIVNGEVRMRDRKTALDEAGILDAAAGELNAALARCDLSHLLTE
ncbi:amidohydrolase family protein [Sulfitobacter sp. KE34]|uniref:Amidohydrolase family protein n=1 Tax=Sulfitobacter faviae TaxID=1775881 RepID=A0AAX3LPZ1_9RHOB|nr:MULTISPECIES: amidohydrolase family protein [Sulfitobacter]MDF3351642.1 amidohydrolase family protein [Sulfitobacter sp. KE12]MDF3355314.1 amidohydrolase family protein [Sulfitobacter sp. KE27]MDF3358962.1 amidohydrolase family protein [Sulfitobacter sp. KE33]MDF3361404.1 amidohydrolase family protein [Sulfitobacter sp. Ks41]MDF3366386.1 amidohydrolase family protein [Sulfitobacter sp. Ks34]